MERNFINSIRTIYNALEDDMSKDIYINRLNYLLTGDWSYVQKYVKIGHPLIPCRNEKQEEEFLKLLPADGSVAFYGTGRFSRKLVPYLKRASFCVLFTDSGSSIDSYEGFEYISFDKVKEDENAYIVICTTKYYEEVKGKLIGEGVDENRIVDIRGYFTCGSGDEYFYEDFLEYEDDEIFVDAGCCDLESSIDFYHICSDLSKVYAFEPDAENYKVCCDKYERIRSDFPETLIYPYGTWSSSTTLQFSSGQAGSSHIGDGETSIQTRAIDEIVDPRDNVTFIKMDVEGAELESLRGAEKTIKRCKPKLAICLYHKPEDMITLPEFIMNLGNDYKYYVRSYSNSENEVVLYAIPKGHNAI